MQEIRTALLPFDAHHRKTRFVHEGLTLQQIADEVKPPCDDFVTYITVNGEMIPSEHWGSIKPKISSVVGVSIAPAGGGDGGKNPLATIVQIATIVAAAYVLGPGGATLGLTATQSAVAAAAISVTGQLISSSLVGTPTQPDFNRSNGIQESPTQFIEGATNAINQWGVVPVNLGKNRMFPPQAAVPFTEAQNDDQFVRQLFTYGYGNLNVTEEKIGETAITEFFNLEEADKFNGDLSDGTSLYSNDVSQESLSITIEGGASETQTVNEPLPENGSFDRTVTTPANTKSVDVVVNFPDGLYQLLFNAEAGFPLEKQVSTDFEIRYSLTGQNNWTVVTRSVSARKTGSFTSFCCTSIKLVDIKISIHIIRSSDS